MRREANQKTVLPTEAADGTKTKYPHLVHAHKAVGDLNERRALRRLGRAHDRGFLRDVLVDRGLDRDVGRDLGRRAVSRLDALAQLRSRVRRHVRKAVLDLRERRAARDGLLVLERRPRLDRGSRAVVRDDALVDLLRRGRVHICDGRRHEVVVLSVVSRESRDSSSFVVIQINVSYFFRRRPSSTSSSVERSPSASRVRDLNKRVPVRTDRSQRQ